MIVMTDASLSVDSPDTIITSIAENNENIPMEMKEAEKIPESWSYNDLHDKPTLNGATIQGDVNEIDPTVSEWAKSQTRPVYTAQDVGALSEGDVVGLSISTLETIWNGI